MKKIFVLIFTMGSLSVNACPELNGKSLAFEESQDIQVLSSVAYKIEKKEYYKIPEFRDMMYKYCANHIIKEKIQAKKTKTIYTTIRTVSDECDGGNSVGTLLNQDETQALAEIGDSEIYCYDSPRNF